MKKYDIAVIGGDKRTACMASVLAGQGYNVICFGTLKVPGSDTLPQAGSLKEALSKASIIVCGIPLDKDGCLFFEEDIPPIPLTELQRLLRKHHKIFGGVISEELKSMCEKRQIGCYDFMQEESLTISNAVATAEGAILEALLHKPTQLHQSETLVLGYGRCGKVLAHKLNGLSAHVTVCSAVVQELATAAALGFQTMPLSDLPQRIHSFEYLFNTIPATVLTKACLEKIKGDALIVDIASNRVGVDYKAASLLQRNVLYCPGLPGRYTALSCAQQLAEYVLKKI